MILKTENVKNDFYSLEDDINNFFEELEEEEEYLINKNLIDRKL